MEQVYIILLAKARRQLLEAYGDPWEDGGMYRGSILSKHR